MRQVTQVWVQSEPNLMPDWIGDQMARSPSRSDAGLRPGMRKHRSFRCRSPCRRRTRRASSASAAVRLIWLICSALPVSASVTYAASCGDGGPSGSFCEVEGTLPSALEQELIARLRLRCLGDCVVGRLCATGACSEHSHANAKWRASTGRRPIRRLLMVDAGHHGHRINTGTGAPTLTANEPFTLTGVFDHLRSCNLIAGLTPPFLAAGWVDYAPLSVLRR